MKKLLFVFAILPTMAYAGDDAVDCSKKPDGSVKCEVKKDNVVVDAVSVNGGDCDVAAGDKILHHAYNVGDKFTVPVKGGGIPIPGLGGCGYVRAVTVTTHDGKSKTFAPL
ncbi:hypothetical protein [Methylocystis echinoides]|uniref:Uncharacterized protein n=1 Tax=Methylocystis echinoides TaxID=29468 RepID=A0A9W6GUE8_9HYPH|nr:hypothetical protein [Methylocystis echinoides]GLI93298.1 hypothetical protein LMG27198_22900 [Methylocystis echinoides]